MKKITKSIICLVLAICMLAPTTALAASRLATPKNLQVVTSTTNSVRVKWGKVKGAAKYTVQYSLNKNFKNAKKVNVSATAATVKNLKAKKYYYFRVRAIKKGRTSSYYTKAIKVKTVLNVDKNLKGTWRDVSTYIAAGDDIYEFRFNGKGKVTVNVYGMDSEKKKTVNYTKSGNTAKFSAFGRTYVARCYNDSTLVHVRITDEYGPYSRIYTKHSDSMSVNPATVKKNFDGTEWDSKFFDTACSEKGYTFYYVGYYDNDDDKQLTASVHSSNWDDEDDVMPIKNNVVWTRLCIDEDFYNVVVEKTAAKKAKAFIYLDGGCKVENWTIL
ncbi:MAG: fibronectin type III domain-containing protein [Eubacterium sp.]|nr:fibronectin type III domain-containing protein [Eubacterium sp.]